MLIFEEHLTDMFWVFFFFVILTHTSTLRYITIVNDDHYKDNHMKRTKRCHTKYAIMNTTQLVDGQCPLLMSHCHSLLDLCNSLPVFMCFFGTISSMYCFFTQSHYGANLEGSCLSCRHQLS